MTTLGKQMQAIHIQLFQKRMDELKEAIRTCIKESIAKNVPTTEVSLSYLSLHYKDTNFKEIMSQLTKWGLSEQLDLKEKWMHGDCSYCEECGPNCFPVSLVFSSGKQ